MTCLFNKKPFIAGLLLLDNDWCTNMYERILYYSIALYCIKGQPTVRAIGPATDHKRESDSCIYLRRVLRCHLSIHRRCWIAFIVEFRA